MVRVALAVTFVGLFALSAPAAAFQVRARGVQQDSLVEKRKELQIVMLRQREIAQEIQRANVAFKRATTEPERQEVRAKLTGLLERLGNTVAELEMVKAHLVALCESRPSPQGWLGITFNADLDVTTSPNATRLTSRRYPVIVSVEPGSPAQKAGLSAGDELITIDSRDLVSASLDVADLLKPGAQLPVRIRREGSLRTVNVLIEPKPQGYGSACPWADVAVAPPNGFDFVITTDSAKPLPRTRKVAPEALPRGAGGITRVLPPTPYTHRFSAGVSGDHAIILGAVLIPLNVDLREGLGLEEGFLVMQVFRGTLALDAGLRAGDIIVGVNGRKPSSIAELIRALDETSDGTWELRVSSRRTGGKPRVVTLRP